MLTPLQEDIFFKFVPVQELHGNPYGGAERFPRLKEIFI